MSLALAATPLIGGAPCGSQEPTPQTKQPSPSAASSGFLKMTLGETDVRIPPEAPEGEEWRYGIGLPL